ncbi:MAG: hypothetical protein OHK0022_51610 [Roseiflexaceae bacterium]
MEQAVIDRFEGGVAVLLVGEAQQPLDVPRSELPPRAKAGQWLRVEVAGGRLLRAELDPEATEAARQRIQEKLARLRRGDHLRGEPEETLQMNHRTLNPSTLSQPVGYSHVVEATAGRTIYISGQVALDAAGNLIGAGDMAAQTAQVFENLKAGLAAAGADFGHVVKFTFFLTDISQMAAVREVRNRYIDMAHPPASSAVEVRRLFRDDLLVEIEAIAVVPG